jgi:hypothetical protein
MTGIALAPVQRLLSEFAELRLASGTVSAEGRLRYGDEAGAKFAYDGSVAVERLLLEEVAAKRPFLAWDPVAAGDIVRTVEPNRVDIGELRGNRPSGRLIIADDGSVNLMDVLKTPKERDGDSAPKQAVPAPAPEIPVCAHSARCPTGCGSNVIGNSPVPPTRPAATKLN